MEHESRDGRRHPRCEVEPSERGLKMFEEFPFEKYQRRVEAARGLMPFDQDRVCVGIEDMGEGGSLDQVDADTLLFYPAGEREAETSPEPERIPMVEVAHREIAGVVRAFLEALDQDGEQLTRFTPLNRSRMEENAMPRRVTFDKYLYEMEAT